LFGFILIGVVTMVAVAAISWQNVLALLGFAFFIALNVSRLD
jgi:hypothetical protein